MKKQLLLDLEAILLTVPSINKATNGKPEPLTTETEFNSVYISPVTSDYVPRVLGTKLKDYDDNFLVELYVNTSNEEDLDWVDVEKDIIEYILDDSALWTNIVDRDVAGSGFGEYNAHPKKQLIIAFEFKLRAQC